MSDFEVSPVGTGKVLQRALGELEAGFRAGQQEGWQSAPSHELKYTTGHCKERANPRGCTLHNLQCGYPLCDRKAVAVAHQDEPVAQGWKLVPVEPTIDMCLAGAKARLSVECPTPAEAAYAAMLAAAPPAKQQAQPVQDYLPDPRNMVPAAWRFRTVGVERSLWRLTDDATLIQQMRELGHWEIRPLVDQSPTSTDTAERIA